MHFFFFKPDLQQTSATPHYAGGQHGFTCAAQALAAAGHSIHLLYTSTKAELMFSLMQHGCMGSLSYSRTVEGVAVWSAPQQGITHHVSLSDAQASTQHELSTAMAALCGGSSSSQQASLSKTYQRLLDECSSLLQALHHQHQQQQQQTQLLQDTLSPHAAWVVLDADGSQEASRRGNSNSSSTTSLMEACCAALPPSKLLLLVQNIHFLPLGPSGTAARTPALLQAWSQLGGVLCVSSFVARYVAQHAFLLGLPPDRIYCVHYAAFGAFGSGPFPDYGTAAAPHLPWPPPSSNTTPPAGGSGSGNSSSDNAACGMQQQGPAGPSSHQPAWRPTIGCLKLSPEKGGALFLDLAGTLPQLQFLAVCGDPVLQAAAAQLPNVTTISPQSDVNAVLQHITVLLAPSVWQEAYGMVVTEALLRGIPVVVSDQGGLAEAALGCAAAVVPVQPMQLPVPGCSTGPAGPTAAAAAGAALVAATPSWQSRVLPQEQDLRPWVQALQQLLGDKGLYEGCSRAGREAALRLVQHQGQLLGQMVDWLRPRQ